jgi:hypothetical protein
MLGGGRTAVEPREDAVAEQDPQDDWALIDAFLAEDPSWTRWPGDAGTILDVGDSETRWVLAERGGRFTFETVQRGHRTTTADFASARDGRRVLLLRLGQSWRSPRRLPDIVRREPAPGSFTTPVLSRHQLFWPGGTAVFSSRSEAVEFSWVAEVEPAVIAASFRDPAGRPLFDLSPEEMAPPPAPRPIPTLLPPRPLRRQPADADAATDRPVVERAASDLGWTLRTTAWPDVLAVGDDQMGRLVIQQRGAFAYQHEHSRKTITYLTSPAAARRFLLLDLGRILRIRRRLPILRVHSTCPDTVLTKGAAQFELAWPGGAATFPLGHNGQQLAQAFSWCARARLDDIVASYRDENGAPLFDRRREHETRPPGHP